jgi:hypothetical protein
VNGIYCVTIPPLVQQSSCHHAESIHSLSRSSSRSRALPIAKNTYTQLTLPEPYSISSGIGEGHSGFEPKLECSLHVPLPLLPPPSPQFKWIHGYNLTHSCALYYQFLYKIMHLYYRTTRNQQK